MHCSFIKVLHIKKAQGQNMYVKPYVIIGSKNCNRLKLLIPNSLEIIRIFEFKDYKGGFIAAEILGEILYEKSFVFAEILVIAGTDG